MTQNVKKNLGERKRKGKKELIRLTKNDRIKCNKCLQITTETPEHVIKKIGKRTKKKRHPRKNKYFPKLSYGNL